MRNKNLVKVLAVLIANILLTVSLVGNMSAYPTHDVVPSAADKVYEVDQSSYFDYSMSGDYLSTSASLDIKVLNDQTKQPISNVNITVMTVSTKEIVGLWEMVFVIIMAAIIAMLVALIIISVLSFGLASVATFGILATLSAGEAAAIGVSGAIGAIIGASLSLFMAGIEDASKRDTLISDANGNCPTLWQDRLKQSPPTYYIYLEDIDKYYDFANSLSIYNADKHTHVTLFLKERVPTTAPYAPTPYDLVQRDVGLFEGMVYTQTDDLFNYDSNTLFNPIDVYTDGKDLGLNPESWKARIMNKTSDVTMIESRRLIFIENGTKASVGGSYDNFHIEVNYWLGDVGGTLLGRNDPSGGVEFNKSDGDYWQSQWVWTIGVWDLDKPITVEAFVNYTQGGTYHLLHAGTELVYPLSDTPYTIEFQYPNQNLIGELSHRTVAEHIYPIIISNMKWSFYSIEVSGHMEISHITTTGFQSIIPIYKTSEGNVTFWNQECNYTQFIQIVDKDGDVVSTSDENYSHFYSWKLTGAQADVITTNVTKETEYAIEVTAHSDYIPAVTYSKGLYYQLTDWDSHNELAEDFKALIDSMFAAGHTITAPELTNLQNLITAMRIKIDTLQTTLNTFVSANGGSKYTDYVQTDINNFKLIQAHIAGLLDGKTAPDLNTDFALRAEVKDACEKLLRCYNLAYLDYSAAVAEAKGEDGVSDDLGDTTIGDRRDIGKYVEVIQPSPYKNILDMLPFFIILLISIGIGGTVAYVTKRSTWNKGDNDNRAKGVALGTFILVSVVAYICISYFATPIITTIAGIL